MKESMEIFIIIFLIVLNALFAMSEMSVINAKKVKLQQLAENGSIGAVKAIELQNNPQRFLSAVQVGITSISILSGIYGEKSLIEPVTHFLLQFGLDPETCKSIANVSVIIFLTFLSVVFGEIIPKTIALNFSDKVASHLSIPIDWISKISFPIVFLFSKTSQVILSFMGMDKNKQTGVSNEEIKELMNQGADAGVFHESEKEMVANILHMDEKRAVSIMTHRNDFIWIDIHDNFEENIQKITNNKYSRTMVVEHNLNNIIGFIHITKIMNMILKGQQFEIKDYLEQPLYLPETIMATQVLEQFKNNRKEIAIIVNEYGENIGLLTVNDIFAALVGEIPNDGEEDNPDIIIREDGSMLINGLISLDKLYQELNLEPIEMDVEVHTLSGLIMVLSGIVPKAGYQTKIENSKYKLELEVLDMDKHCVDKVLMRKILIE